MTDEEIIRLLEKRDDKGLRALSQKYSRLILKTARNILSSQTDVEECANDTLMAVWDAIPPDKPGNLAAYVAKIARRKTLNRLRYNTAPMRNSDLLSELDECLPSNLRSVEETAELAELTNAERLARHALRKSQAAVYGAVLQRAGDQGRGAALRNVPHRRHLRALANESVAEGLLRRKELAMNKINPIFEALGDVDERHIPAARGKKLANKLTMGLAAAAAAVLALGGGIVMLTHNRADIEITDDENYEEVTVKSGKYYLNGDVNSGLWIVITPETISLKGDDIEASLREAAESTYAGQEVSEEHLQNYMNDIRLLYCEEKPYFAEVMNLQHWRCVINVDRRNRPVENREDLRNTNAAFLYDDITNKIHLSVFGDFILVE